jgi:hypothetical protein
MDWVVVIPSYKRATVLKDKTFALLLRYNIPKDLINIFVGNPEEYLIYKEHFPDINIVIGVVGLKEQRDFIGNYYPIGKHIVSFDDDLTALCTLENGKLVPLPSLINLIDQGFKNCIDYKFHLWGISPVANAFYMKDVIHTDLKFCIGHMWGVINRRIPLTLCYKEDYERTLQNAVRDGGVIRFSGVAAKTKLGASGGLNTTQEQRLGYNLISSKTLIEQYPGLVRPNKKRQGEILLSRKVICPVKKTTPLL